MCNRNYAVEQLFTQIEAFVGKIHHRAKQRKIYESSSRMQCLLVKTYCTYKSHVHKVHQTVLGDTSPSCSYHLSDSSGIDITGGNTEFGTNDDGAAIGNEFRELP